MGDGRLLQLNSFENRVFQVFLEEAGAVVAKFYRPHRWSDEQILEEHSFSAELCSEEIPVVAPLVLESDPSARMRVRCVGTPSTLGHIALDGHEHRFSVCARMAGRAPELESREVLEWLGRFIGRLHAIGSRKRFDSRRKLTMAEFGWGSRDWLLQHANIPPEIETTWKSAADAALRVAEEAFDRLGDVRQIRLHGDCHVGNVLWTDAGPHFVDLDDCLTGPAIQDLWMLLSGDPTAAKHQLNALLSGYERFMDFDDRELQLVEPLRTLRIMHQSAWLAKRWADPAFPPNFPWFTSGAYWQQMTQQLEQQTSVASSIC